MRMRWAVLALFSTGLALFSRPYAWIGLVRTDRGFAVTHFDGQSGESVSEQIGAMRVWRRASCDFMTEQARFSYSLDGESFKPVGSDFTMVFQLKTFQGVRYSLFAFNSANAPGGNADFDSIDVEEPDARGMKPIPVGQTIAFFLANGAANPRESLLGNAFLIVDRGLGRVSLRRSDGYLTVAQDGAVSIAGAAEDPGQSSQWMETLTGEILLMSLKTHRYVRLDSEAALRADSPGPSPDGRDGTRFDWRPVTN